jgi:uncharacterized membrane protein YgcG
MLRRTNKPRKALTLLEVVISLAIFLFSVIAIWQLMLIGSDRATEVSLLARTSMRCQGKLAEVMMGAETNVPSGGYVPYTDDPNLQYRVEVDTTGNEIQGARLVKVFVKSDLPSGKTIESQLCQYILDPQYLERGSTMDQTNTPEPGTPTTNSTTPSSTTPASNGGGGGAGGMGGAGPTKGGKGGNTKTGGNTSPLGGNGGATKAGSGTKTGGGAVGAAGGTGAGGGAGAGGGTGAGGAKGGS